ncbi:MAG: ATP-grasp domain-containing protein [Ignavibacteriaceae bacterium]
MFGISREAQIPAILDMLNIPYSGSDALTLTVTLDKSRAKEILSYYKIPNAPFQIFNELGELNSFHLNFPVIIKPIAEGSGKGITSASVVYDVNNLKLGVDKILSEYKQPALVEEFLEGREFTVAILGNGQEAVVLPIIEIDFTPFPKDFTPIYSYEAKWILDSKENQLDIFSCPAKISNQLENSIREIALSTYNTLRCKDWSRIDMRLDRNNIPNVIEINPLPGILPDPRDNSCYPKAARAAGMDYNTMINKVLNVARKRYSI